MVDAAPAAWWKRLGALSGTTLAVLVALLVAVAAADRSGVTLDLSADQRFTLHPRLIAAVHQQAEPVAITGFWGVAEREALASIELLGERLGGLNPQVTWQRLDPELQKPLVAAFAERHGQAVPRSIALTRGDRLYRIDLTPNSRLTLQRDLGAALAALADPTPPKAVLVTGHGELRPDGGITDGADQLLRTLAQSGFQAEARTPASATAPPPSAVLVVGGATAPFGADLDLLQQHLQDGGGILVLADDRLPSDLRTWLRRRGVIVGALPPRPDLDTPLPPALVVHAFTRHQAGQESRFPYHNLVIAGDQVDPGHPITATLAQGGVTLLSPWTAPVWPLEPQHLSNGAAEALKAAYATAGTPPFAATTLMATMPHDAWLKARAAPLDEPQELEQAPAIPLAVALDYLPTPTSVQAGVGGRLVVWGSRQAASDGLLTMTAFANEGLLRSSLGWLARRSPPSDIPPAEFAAFQVAASDGTLSLITALLLAVVPCLCLGWAMLMWWDRR